VNIECKYSLLKHEIRYILLLGCLFTSVTYGNNNSIFLELDIVRWVLRERLTLSPCCVRTALRLACKTCITSSDVTSYTRQCASLYLIQYRAQIDTLLCAVLLCVSPLSCYLVTALLIPKGKPFFRVIKFDKTISINRPVPVAARSKAVGLRPLACWDCGFESHRGHGCLSVVSVLCWQVEFSATSWSLVQRSRNECGASLCVI